MEIKPRLTTAEAAEILGCDPTTATATLRLASIPHTRQGRRRGAFLWDAGAVHRLAGALHSVADPLASIIRQAIEAHRRGEFAERDKGLAALRELGVDLRFASELAQDSKEGGAR